MFFKEIELTDFRNYEYEKVSFHRFVNVFTGRNAQGKTNLMESLYIMSLGKSFRAVKDADMIRFGAAIGRAKALIEKDDRDMEIEIGLVKGGKSIRIDGVSRKKTSDLLEQVYVVMFSPEDLRIIKDEPARRRRFIDRELCKIRPVYYSSLLRYRKTLQQRNTLLKEGVINEEILNVWDEELAEYGSRLVLERKRFIEQLSSVSRSIYEGLTVNSESLSAAYEADIAPAETLREQKERFTDVLIKNRKNDLLRRSTGRGPHHDDIRLDIDGVPVRQFGSQGQQRSAALSLKLAEIEIIRKETGQDPVLLLDDVLSELDETRQKQLINLFRDTQIFITATALDDRLRAQIPEHALFEVSSGHVERVY
ncbi:MAG: DNA replication/repair protein RecF [Solobacterium sp.]|nr:DNA replication/repair protein RecF [Solobacterium sp.]